VESSHQLPATLAVDFAAATAGQTLSATTCPFGASGQTLSPASSPLPPEPPARTPTVATAAKVATSTERSNLLRIVGFVLT
jgi:hypothetical protein